MTEFALVLPVFVLIIAGLLSFGGSSSTDRGEPPRERDRALGGGRQQSLRSGDAPQAARDASSKEFQKDVKVCIDFPPAPSVEILCVSGSRSPSRSSRS